MFKPVQPRTLEVKPGVLPEQYGQPVLFPIRMTGTEALGKLYRYELEMATVDSPELNRLMVREQVISDELIGKVLTVSIEFYGKGETNEGAGVRTIAGVMTDIALTGTDDRHAYYRITIRPWLWLAKKTVRTRIFQNMNVLDITKEVVGANAYGMPWEMRLSSLNDRGGYPQRDFVRQMYETDYDFLRRIWFEWGIYFHFDGLKLILCDHSGSHHKHENAYDDIPYHAPEGQRFDEEHIGWLEATRKITAGQVQLDDYDYTQSRGIFTNTWRHNTGSTRDNALQQGWGEYSQSKAGAAGEHGPTNDYENESSYLARVRVEAMRCRGRRVRGRGNLPGLTTGKAIRVTAHPVSALNAQYLVVSTTIDICNVAETSVRPGAQQGYTCTVDFTLHQFNSIQYRMKPRPKPHCRPETAVVVGPENQPLWLDGYARVKVRYIWDRQTPADDQASCWVRVATPWMGHGYGMVAHPRIGDEVTISYHEGDPDKPYVSDRHVNEFNEPPWRMPVNDALTGTLTRGLEGPGHNQIVADDTPGKLQVQVTSSHANSRLVLGHNTKISPGDGRQQERGEGFELATEAHGVARANKGMLITTEARPGCSAPVKDMGETVQRLTRAREQQAHLAALALQNQAVDQKHDQNDVAQTIETQNDQIRGLAAEGTGGAFPELTAAHLVLASPAGIEATSARSTHIASNDHIALTSGRHLSMSIGGRLLASAINGFRLFCQKAGIRLIAAGGDIDLKSLSDSINILAKLNITQTANRITLTAKEELLINGGGSYTKWNGSGVETGTAGSWTVHSAARSLVGPKSMVNSVPVTAVKHDGPHAISFMALAAEGNALKDAAISLFDPTKSKPVLHAMLDSDGSTTIVHGDSNERYDALVGYEGWSAHFEEANNGNEGEFFDPGELDEDRDLELL